MARFTTDISNVKRGDRIFHENPPGSSFIVDRVVGKDLSSGHRGYLVHSTPEEHPHLSFRVGTQVVIDRRSLDELSQDELKAELDRRMKVRQLHNVREVKEKLAELIVEVRTIQGEHYELSSGIADPSHAADDMLEELFQRLIEAERRLEQS